MEWTNEMVLKFLNLFELEPVIWNPKHEENRKKNSVADAWRRIQSRLGWECRIEDLKRKKDSLMAYYRIHARKIKKVKNSDTNEAEFKTNWFAFEAMNSFLGDVYDCAGVTSSEETNGGWHSLTMETSECASNDSHSQASISDRRDPIEVPTPKHTMDNFMTKQDRTHMNETMNECEMYAQLLARKLAKLDEDDRLTLMNSIDNIVFQATMRAKRKRKHASPADVDVLHPPYDCSDDTQPSSSRRVCHDRGASPYRTEEESRTDYFLSSTAPSQYKSPTVSLLPESKLQPQIIKIKQEMEKDDHEAEVETYTIHTVED